MRERISNLTDINGGLAFGFLCGVFSETIEKQPALVGFKLIQGEDEHGREHIYIRVPSFNSLPTGLSQKENLLLDVCDYRVRLQERRNQQEEKKNSVNQKVEKEITSDFFVNKRRNLGETSTSSPSFTPSSSTTNKRKHSSTEAPTTRRRLDRYLLSNLYQRPRVHQVLQIYFRGKKRYACRKIGNPRRKM